MAEDKARINALDEQLTKAQERERRQAGELTSSRVAVEACNARLEQAQRTIGALKDGLAEARASERTAIEHAAVLRGAQAGKNR